MNQQKTLELLAINEINNNEFYEKLYRTLLVGVFEVICKEIKKQNTKAVEKERFRKYNNKITAARILVKEYAGCQLSEDGYEEMARLLTAYFRTGDPRKRFDDSFRTQLLNRQKNQCAICKKEIALGTSHLDHIIPWDYVGDNLDDNYQMLCATCNERKGTAAYFEFSMLLLNKGKL